MEELTEGTESLQTLPRPIKCAACDLIIDPCGPFEVGSSKKLTSETSGNNNSREDLLEKYIPKPEVWSTFCKYLLDGRVSTREKLFLTKHADDLTFCAFCMRQINRIHAFENEITQLYERIDSMITCIRTKIQTSLEGGSRKEENSQGTVREFMLGIEPLNKTRPKNVNPKGRMRSLDPKILSRKGGSKDSKKQLLAEPPTGSEEVQDPNLQLETKDIVSEDKEPESRSSRRDIKSGKIKSEFYAEDEGEMTPEDLESDSGNEKERDRDSKAKDSDFDYDSNPEAGGDQETPSKIEMGEEDEAAEKKRSLRKRSGRARSDPISRKKRDKKDNRERKTARRRLTINQIQENLYEWKGFKFRKLEDGKHICELCPTTILKSQPNLVLHIRKLHLREGVGVFPCQVCGKTFERAEILKAHMFIHDEKRFQCYLCGKCYRHRGNLSHHIKTHVGQLRYRCEFEGCDKAFLTRNQLTRHTTRHLGVKSFQCEYCSRLFLEVSQLNRHVLSHAEQMPFSCHLCKSSFFIKYRLNRHYKNVHKTEPPEVIEKIEPKLPPKPTLVGGESVDGTGFVEETIESSGTEGIHKELITFESMLE